MWSWLTPSAGNDSERARYNGPRMSPLARMLWILALGAGCTPAHTPDSAKPVAVATPVAEPDPEPPRPRIDPTALDALRARAQRERSAALLLWVDGELVLDESFGYDPDTPLVAMSVTKSIVALRVGQMVEDGHVDLDAPLSEALVPEWQDTANAGITLRHLLSHTSGLSVERYANDGEGFRTKTIEGHIPAMSLVAEPGTQFAYNNAAVDLLAVVLRRADPQRRPLDDQMEASLFEPMGVVGATWMEDAAGDPRAAGELVIRPRDLVAIGQLVLERGHYDGRSLVPESWIDAMLQPGPYPGCGLLWWLDRREGEDAVASYVADGYLGQYIVVVPEARAVAVRMRDGNTTSWDPEEFSYREFRSDVLALFDPKD